MLYFTHVPVPRLPMDLRSKLPFPLALALVAAAALAGCFGGQSGDEGLDIMDDDFVATSEAQMVCLGARPDGGGDEGYSCTPSGDAGVAFDCDCAGEHRIGEAESCEDALRDHCGVEPMEAPVGPPDEEELGPPGPPGEELPQPPPDE